MLTFGAELDKHLQRKYALSLTYLGHSAFKFELKNLRLYTDPYFQDPVDFARLDPGALVLFSHGHFDHGVLSSAKLWNEWKCQFIGPRRLVDWMVKKYRRVIPADAFIALDHGESTIVNGTRITAVPAHHPLTRLARTIHAVFARSSSPGNPVNGYHFEGFYHAGDTLYTPAIAEFLHGFETHTACLPIGGKYKVASPQEALRIAEEIKAVRMVPMHWQPIVEQVPFRYQPSHLARLAKATGSPVQICAMAIGEVLEDLKADELKQDQVAD
jgi:L-ascorbate metabolism protein UlaG (beta-lactamase superfamily)